MTEERQKKIKEEAREKGFETPALFAFFKNKDDKVEFKTVNLMIKIVGLLAAFALLIFIIQTIGESIFQPLFTFLAILSPFIVGIVFAWLLTPVVSALVKRHWKPTTASLFVTIVGVTLLVILFTGFGYVVLSSVIRFFTGGYNINMLFENVDIVQLVNAHINNDFEHDGLLQLVVQMGVFFGFIDKLSITDPTTLTVTNTYILSIAPGNSLTDFIASSASYFWKFVIAAMVMGFLLPNFSNFGKNVKSIIPKTVKKEWSEWIDIMGESFSDYMKGALTIASIIGSVYVVGLGLIALLSSTVFYVPGETSILSTQNTGIVLVILTIFTFGILGSLTNLIPYAGPFIGGIPIIIIIALNDTTNNYWVTICSALLLITAQSLESLFLQPYLMGKQTRLHPVAILLGLTVFGSLFGIVGMLIATPIISVVRSLIQFYNSRYDIF